MKRLLLSAALIFCCGVAAHQQEQERDKPEGFSPLGFEDLRQYIQSYPGEASSLAVARASAARYWVFRGIAYRGSQPQGAAWASLGPLSTTNGGASGTGNFSGRVAALAISPTCEANGPCRLWVGTAGGGVWRTDNAMDPVDPQWRWIGQGLGTNSIGALAVDPNDGTGNTIFVGTGETNSPQNSGAGTGLYRSDDGGDRWTRLSTTIVDSAVSPSAIDFTSTRGIGAIAIEPGNPKTIYVGTTTAMLGMTAVRGGQSQVTGYPQPRVGLYKTTDGGATWTLAWVPPLDPVIPPNPNATPGQGDTMIGVRDVKLDPRTPRIVYVSAWNNAIHRSAPSLENGDASFKPVFALEGFERFQDLAMFALTEARGHARVYAYNGTLDFVTQGLYRLDDADVPAANLVSGTGASLHNTGAWIRLTSEDARDPGSTSFNLCGSQCFYDLVVATPPGRPDTVLLGGVALPQYGEGTIRSTNAGASFQAFGSDAQTPRSTSHVDVRAIVFHPKAPDIAFVGSDGGVVRNDGTFTSIASRCPQIFGNAPQQCATVLSSVPTRLYFLNRGLQTLQFYNISPDPRAPLQRLMGGLQDNGTIWIDGSGAAGIWTAVFPAGDGTSASGFHPSRPGVIFASFQSNNFFVNFANGDPSRWVRTGDPIRAANERATITASTGRQFMSFDEVNPDTQFTGFQHVWRTKDNGGGQAALEGNCRSLTPAPAACGDWVPLGVAFPFAAGSTPESGSRRPGDLTGDVYGADRTGGIVVSAERSPLDAGTLWAATSTGRLFIAKNGDAVAPDVVFTRIDTPVTPNRFVTRIVPDRTDVDAAFVSYSGFNALTPSAPGHVFRAAFNPSTRLTTFTSLDRDLGDLPINTLAVDDVKGDVYAGTDFGPLVLRKGSPAWEAAGAGFPEALMVDLKYMPSQRLLIAATHGLGIFYLRLD